MDDSTWYGWLHHSSKYDLTNGSCAYFAPTHCVSAWLHGTLCTLTLQLSPSHGFGHQLTKGTGKERGTTAASLRKPNWNVKFSCVIFCLRKKAEALTLLMSTLLILSPDPPEVRRLGKFGLAGVNWPSILGEPATAFSPLANTVYHKLTSPPLVKV